MVLAVVLVACAVGVCGTLWMLLWRPRIDQWRCWRFLVEERNPVLQLTYLTLVCGIFHLFEVHASPRLSVTLQWGAWLVVAMALGSFVWAIFSSPTVIDKRNVARLSGVYAPDGLVFALDAKDCPTCKQKKPARSKHCAICDHCVHVFDHHCHWLNVCIGSNNKLQFLVFLLCTSIACFYCVACCVLLVVRLARPQSLVEFLMVFVMRGGVLFGMAFVTYVLGLTLFAFLLFHLRLAARGETHNEATKRTRLQQAARVRHVSVDWRNPYDQGVWRNWWSVIAARE